MATHQSTSLTLRTLFFFWNQSSLTYCHSKGFWR